MNFLPILLMGGAAAVVVSASGKKKGSKSRVIDMGLYSYSSNCKHLWIGSLDVAKPGAIHLDAEQNEVMNQFVAGPLQSAIKAAVETREGDPKWGDKPFWITELALGTVAELVPRCKFKEGNPTGAAALALLPLVLGRIGVYLHEHGVDSKDFLAAAALETMLMAQASAKAGGKVDIVKMIREARS